MCNQSVVLTCHTDSDKRFYKYLGFFSRETNFYLMLNEILVDVQAAILTYISAYIATFEVGFSCTDTRDMLL